MNLLLENALQFNRQAEQKLDSIMVPLKNFGARKIEVKSHSRAYKIKVAKV